MANMDESYGIHVDDEYHDNHDCDNTDDDTDDDNDQKKDSYTAAAADPDAGAAPGSWPYMAGPPRKAVEVTGT